MAITFRYYPIGRGSRKRYRFEAVAEHPSQINKMVLVDKAEQEQVAEVCRWLNDCGWKLDEDGPSRVIAQLRRTHALRFEAGQLRRLPADSTELTFAVELSNEIDYTLFRTTWPCVAAHR